MFLTYRYRAGLDAIVGRAMTREPIFDFTAADGIRHTGWQLAPADVAAVVAEFANVPCTYIADGHHRAASAARVRQHCRSANPRHTGGEEYNRVLAVAFPDNQLRMALRYNGDKRVLPAIDALDVSLLQKLLLEPAFGITDPRTSKEIDFVGGIRGTAELERLVDSGRAALAFALYPTTVAELMAIADAGGIMPPKSTWFEPKLRDGLFIHDI
ncbi:MAG: hypothetical protein BWY71_01396 [Planctomycetes bacterium ADurb.Bin412]|nr:MAG: hypothetical protein BWY71_01396 [Planctomycetes bacterium ADurb.Bin412]